MATNCRQCRDNLTAYAELLLDEDQRRQVADHLQGCPACRAELDDLERIRGRLMRDGQAAGRVSLDAGVMGRIVRRQATELRDAKRRIRRTMMRKRYPLIGAITAAVAVVSVLAIWPAAPDNRAQAAEALAKGARAAAGLRSIHIQFMMRTPPRDNFAAISAKGKLVPVELWKQFGGQSRWRIEKPGRVVAMDGTSTVMLMRPRTAIKVRASKAAFDTEWLHNFAAVDQIVERELKTALAKDWGLSLTHETAKDGSRTRVVTVEAKAGLDDGDHLKNRFFTMSDNRRVYRFDVKTSRLKDLKVYLRRKSGDLLILKVSRIDYDPKIAPSVFALELPEDVVWWQPPKTLPDNKRYEKMTPDQAARAFFEACGRQDWEEVQKFWPGAVEDEFKQALGGLKIIKIGEPFQAKSAKTTWFVPYEIQFKSGRVKKWNLALKKDKRTRRHIVDGGL